VVRQTALASTLTATLKTARTAAWSRVPGTWRQQRMLAVTKRFFGPRQPESCRRYAHPVAAPGAAGRAGGNSRYRSFVSHQEDVMVPLATCSASRAGVRRQHREVDIARRADPAPCCGSQSCSGPPMVDARYIAWGLAEPVTRAPVSDCWRSRVIIRCRSGNVVAAYNPVLFRQRAFAFSRFRVFTWSILIPTFIGSPSACICLTPRTLRWRRGGFPNSRCSYLRL
jgi:hypothetical protein